MAGPPVTPGRPPGYEAVPSAGCRPPAPSSGGPAISDTGRPLLSSLAPFILPCPLASLDGPPRATPAAPTRAEVVATQVAARPVATPSVFRGPSNGRGNGLSTRIKSPRGARTTGPTRSTPGRPPHSPLISRPASPTIARRGGGHGGRLIATPTKDGPTGRDGKDGTPPQKGAATL